MTLPEQQKTPAPANWSVDFVEHLRAVHFALVGLAAALIFLGLSKRDVTSAKALTEATQLFELHEHWSRVDEAYRYAWAKAADIPQFLNVSVHLRLETPAPRSVEVSFLDVEVTQFDPWRTSREATDFFWRQAPYRSTFDSRFFTQSAPDTIADFREWWDGVHGGIPMDIPQFTGVYDRCQVVVEGATKARRGCSAQSERFTTNEENLSVTKPTLERVSHRAIRTDAGDFHVIGTRLAGVLASHESRVALGVSRVKSARILLDVRDERVDFDESPLLPFFPGTATKGEFDTAFTGLASLPTEITVLPLQDALTRIRDLQDKGEQTIEALGLRIPAKEFTRAGIALLFAALSYFWLHLFEFNSKVEPTSPGLDVAWIGVYRSRAAFVVMIFSCCVLPATALWILLDPMVTDAMRHSDAFARRALPACFGLLGATLIALTLERLVRLRKLLTTDAGLAELPASGNLDTLGN